MTSGLDRLTTTAGPIEGNVCKYRIALGLPFHSIGVKLCMTFPECKSVCKVLVLLKRLIEVSLINRGLSLANAIFPSYSITLNKNLRLKVFLFLIH